jgi:hypothetical protein
VSCLLLVHTALVELRRELDDPVFLQLHCASALPTPLPTGGDYNYDYNSNYDHNYYYWLVWILCCIDLKLCDSVMI